MLLKKVPNRGKVRNESVWRGVCAVVRPNGDVVMNTTEEGERRRREEEEEKEEGKRRG